MRQLLVFLLLNCIVTLTVDEDEEGGGTLVMPGHGPLCDWSDIIRYRGMVTMT